MKKLLCLVLVALMALSAVTAFATNSKTNEDITTTTTTPEQVPDIIIIDDTEASKELKETFKAAAEAGDILSPLPDDIKAQLPEGLTKMNECVTAILNANRTTVGDIVATITFQTPYEKDTEVAVLIGYQEGNEWKFIVLEGTVKEEGKVTFVLTEKLQDVLENKEFVIAILSK